MADWVADVCLCDLCFFAELLRVQFVIIYVRVGAVESLTCVEQSTDVDFRCLFVEDVLLEERILPAEVFSEGLVQLLLVDVILLGLVVQVLDLVELQTHLHQLGLEREQAFADQVRRLCAYYLVHDCFVFLFQDLLVTLKHLLLLDAEDTSFQVELAVLSGLSD